MPPKLFPGIQAFWTARSEKALFYRLEWLSVVCGENRLRVEIYAGEATLRAGQEGEPQCCDMS